MGSESSVRLYLKRAVPGRSLRLASFSALQISHSICSEVSEAVDLRDITEGNWRDNPGIMSPEWRGVSRGVCDAGSHPHAVDVIPPKFSVAHTVGFLKGKSAIRIFREYLQVKRNFTGRHFWARGYCVSTVGLEEQVIRESIRTQEREETRQEQMRLAGL